MNKKLFILALGAAMVAVSCEEKNPQIIDPEVDLIGDITENRILEEGQTYTLTGGLHVKAGATLTIEPGVTIVAQDDDQVDYILIEQGAMIDARGTASAPIVMTSTRKEAGPPVRKPAHGAASTSAARPPSTPVLTPSPRSVTPPTAETSLTTTPVSSSTSA